LSNTLLSKTKDTIATLAIVFILLGIGLMFLVGKILIYVVVPCLALGCVVYTIWFEPDVKETQDT
jgi:Na+-transporting methylmalonyl-CoA/oxaloacetate decarboxylase gamma subunit